MCVQVRVRGRADERDKLARETSVNNAFVKAFSHTHMHTLTPCSSKSMPVSYTQTV